MFVRPFFSLAGTLSCSQRRRDRYPVAVPFEAFDAVGVVVAGNPPNIVASLDAARLRASDLFAPALPDPDRDPPLTRSEMEIFTDPDYRPLGPPPPLTRQQIEDIQAILAEQDRYKGEIDGLVGPMTQKAAAAFRKAMGLDDSDAVDRGLARALVDTAPPVGPPGVDVAEPLYANPRWGGMDDDQRNRYATNAHNFIDAYY